MSASLSLVSINIEGSKHLDRIKNFFEGRAVDIVTLQEVIETDIPYLENVLGMPCFFTPVARHESSESERIEGTALFLKLPAHTYVIQYAGVEGPLPIFQAHDDTGAYWDEAMYLTRKYSLAIAEFEKEGITHRVMTTHFAWSDKGAVTEIQWVCLSKLLTALSSFDSFVLTGDFNAPRGTDIFDAIAAKYTDTIPHSYTSSIDGTLHRAGALPYMVDGLFSTEDYHASDVALKNGVSDHCAIVANLSK